MHMYHGHCLTLVELRNNKVIIYASKFVHFFSNQTSMHMQCRWWLRPMQQKKLFKLCYSSCKMYSFLYKGQDEKVWWQPSNDCDDKSKQKKFSVSIPYENLSWMRKHKFNWIVIIFGVILQFLTITHLFFHPDFLEGILSILKL